MTYPNSPFGQGFPGQPGDQQPLYTQQPPPPILGQPGYPGQQPPAQAPGEPSGVTGTIAAVLAGLGGVVGLGSGAITGFHAFALHDLMNISGGTYAIVIVGAVISAAFGLPLLIGAILLFQAKIIGRWLVVGGCAGAIASVLFALVVDTAIRSDYPGYPGATTPVSLASLIFPIATLVLALVPSTAAWIEAKQNPAAAQPSPQNPVAPQPYPQYPGWG